jgi:hypothetical protein
MAGMETSVNYLACPGQVVQEATARSQLAIVFLVKLDGMGRNASNNVGTVLVHVQKPLAHVLTVFQDFGVQLVHRNVQERVKCVINQMENVCFARTDIGVLVALESVTQKTARDVMLIQEYAKNVKQGTGVRTVRRNVILVMTKGVIFFPAYAKTVRTDMQENIATYFVTHLDVQIGTATKDRDLPAPLVKMGIGEQFVEINVSGKIVVDAVKLREHAHPVSQVFGEIRARKNVR